MLVKDLIRKLQRLLASHQTAIFSMEQIHCFVLNTPETLNYQVKNHWLHFKGLGNFVINRYCDNIMLLNDGGINILIKYSKTNQVGKGHNFLLRRIANHSCVWQQKWRIFWWIKWKVIPVSHKIRQTNWDQCNRSFAEIHFKIFEIIKYWGIFRTLIQENLCNSAQWTRDWVGRIVTWWLERFGRRRVMLKTHSLRWRRVIWFRILVRKTGTWLVVQR